jgi:hypothetical protein
MLMTNLTMLLSFNQTKDYQNVNDDVGHFFQTRKNIRQGDPLSPLLFNLVTGMLAILINRGKEDEQIAGVVPHLANDGISILQYTDDTIIFMDHDLDKAQNMKLLLRAFEQVLSLKINFHKSKLFCFGQTQNFVEQYTYLFGCQEGGGGGSFKILRNTNSLQKAE